MKTLATDTPEIKGFKKSSFSLSFLAENEKTNQSRKRIPLSEAKIVAPNSTLKTDILPFLLVHSCIAAPAAYEHPIIIFSSEFDAAIETSLPSSPSIPSDPY